MDKQQAEQQYMQLQQINEQIQQLQGHMETVENQIVELTSLQKDLDTLSGVQSGTEILVPISSGVFAKAKIDDPNQLVVNVGASTLTAKNIPDVKQLMGDQTKNLQKLQEKILSDLKTLVDQAGSLQKTLSESKHV